MLNLSINIYERDEGKFIFVHAYMQYKKLFFESYLNWNTLLRSVKIENFDSIRIRYIPREEE